MNQRFVIAMLVYAALATAASFALWMAARASSFWLFLGLFAVKSLLAVLKDRRTD